MAPQRVILGRAMVALLAGAAFPSRRRAWAIGAITLILFAIAMAKVRATLG